jgi:hypothetical protein
MDGGGRKPDSPEKLARRLTGFEVVSDAKSALDVLWEIALDPHINPANRVLAAKAILIEERHRAKAAGAPPSSEGESNLDPIAARAALIMANFKKGSRQ